jgi:hypothetical protein
MSTRKHAPARKRRASKQKGSESAHQQRNPQDDTADQLATMIGAETTEAERRWMLALGVCAFARQMINLNTPASAEIARAIYLAACAAWERNRREVYGQVHDNTLVFDFQDRRESEAGHQHMLLINEIKDERPQLYQIRYERRHAGKQPIQVQTNDAAHTCSIERGDTVYFEVIGPRDLEAGDIAGSYWCETGRAGWQTFIGRIELRDGEMIAVNDIGEQVVQPGELCRITAVEKPLGREAAALIAGSEEWDDLITT